VLLAGLLLGGVSAPARADTVEMLPGPGVMYQTVVDVAHKQVPLPPGQWQVAGRGDESLAGNAPGAYGVIESLVLVRPEGGSVGSFVVIHANALPVDRGWGTNSDCAAAALPLVRVYDDAGTNLFCAFGGGVTVRRDGAAPEFWREALELARTRHWTVPEHWLMGGFRISDRHDVLEVRYYYQPAPPPLVVTPQTPPPGVIAASWSGQADAAVPAPVPGPGQDTRASWLPALRDWSEAMKHPIEQGFKGRPSESPEIPALPSERALRGEGGHAAATDQPVDGLTALFQRSVIKMLSWKVLGVSAGFAIKYLFIGDLTTAAGLQVATSVVTGVLYVGYDMLWATVFPDRYKPVIDFSTVAEPS
jgi:uncharacterized membrane protein